MSALKFSFQEMLDEISALAVLSDQFIAQRSKRVLLKFQKELEGYRASSMTGAFDWIISEVDPLLTECTKEYEPGGGGARRITAEITSKWRIKKDPSLKRSKQSSFFSLVGLASTRVRLKYCSDDGGAGDELGMWRMEIADSKSPGCFFHTQILGQDEICPFPKSVSIPRLPILTMTPAAVVEFVLAELFQDRWGPHIALQVPELNRWAPIQKRRMKRLLEWKLELFAKTAVSPWVALKVAQPDADIFSKADR